MIFRILTLVVFLFTIVVGCATSNPGELSPGTSAGSPSTNEDVEAILSDTYLLGQGDAISIQVFDEPDLTLQTVIGASGSINYSYLGDLKVTGKSPAELEKFIAGKLQNGYLVNPSVNVRVTEYRPFFISGEVRSPGRYAYQPGLTLDKAITLAGGLTDRASTRKVYVIKADDKDSREIPVPMSFRVQPGDTITIKEGFF